MKPIIIISVAFGLSACVAVRPTVSELPVESRSSFVERDMSQQKVGRILGAHTHESFDAADSSTSCRSYPYGDPSDPRYVIVYFQHELAGPATDGHLKPCEFGGDIL